MQTNPASVIREHRIELPSEAVSNRLMELRPFVRQSGDEWREPWFMKSRSLLDYLLVYIADGTGHFTVGQDSFDVGKGDLIWIPPDTPHEMQGFTPKMRCLYLHFDLQYDPKRSHWDAFIPGGTVDLKKEAYRMHPPVADPVISSWHGKIPLSNQSAVLAMIEKICLEHQRSPASSVLSIAGMMLQLIDLILFGSISDRQTGQSHILEMQDAASRIMALTDRELDVSKLAADFQMSASHFRKVFRETFGMSARSVHRQARIRKASSLLVYNNLAIAQIAGMLGFSTVHNFSRAFKEVTGMAPGEYRKSGEA